MSDDKERLVSLDLSRVSPSQHIMHHPVKRGLLRPNGGHSRAPMFVILGLVMACLLLLYNFYMVGAERNVLQEKFSLLSVKHRQLLRESTETQATIEKLKVQLSESEKEKDLKLGNLREAQEKVEKLEQTKQELDNRVNLLTKQSEDSISLKDEEVKKLRADLETAENEAKDYRMSSDQCVRNISLLNGEVSKLRQELKIQKQENMQKSFTRKHTGLPPVVEKSRRKSRERTPPPEPKNPKEVETETERQKTLQKLLHGRYEENEEKEQNSTETDSETKLNEKENNTDEKQIPDRQKENKPKTETAAENSEQSTKTTPSILSSSTAQEQDNKLATDGGFDRRSGAGADVLMHRAPGKADRHFVRDEKNKEEPKFEKPPGGEESVFNRLENEDEGEKKENNMEDKAMEDDFDNNS